MSRRAVWAYVVILAGALWWLRAQLVTEVGVSLQQAVALGLPWGLLLDLAMAQAAPADRTFAELGLPKSLVMALSKRGIETPFAIQSAYRSYNTQVGSVQFGALQSPNQMRAITANLRFRF